jgi:hypothetical protein
MHVTNLLNLYDFGNPMPTSGSFDSRFASDNIVSDNIAQHS